MGNDKPIDPDFIAKQSKQAKTEPQPIKTSEGLNIEVRPPNVFDEARIREDLQRFARVPGLFEQYVDRVYNRFTKSGEIAYLKQWVKFYDTGRKLIESRTALERANTDHKQIEHEGQIKSMAKEAEIAKLEADKEEHLLRKDQAAYKRKNVNQFATLSSSEPSPDDAQFNEYRSKRRNDVRWRIYEDTGIKVTNIVELKKWKKEECASILADRSLSPPEQADALEFLNELYADKLDTLKAAKEE